MMPRTSVRGRRSTIGTDRSCIGSDGNSDSPTPTPRIWLRTSSSVSSSDIARARTTASEVVWERGWRASLETPRSISIDDDDDEKRYKVKLSGKDVDVLGSLEGVARAKLWKRWVLISTFDVRRSTFDVRRCARMRPTLARE